MNPPILVLILAGGKSERLHPLGRLRTAPALPYGGKYRVIDFSLSNCVHSGLHRIGMLTQYAPMSLHGHIGIGRAWDLDRRDGGIRLLQPYVRQRETNWYRGTADALVQNRNVIADAQARHILVLSGDLVTKMDYAPLIARHEERGAALTMVTVAAPSDESERYGYVSVDGHGRVRGLNEKPSKPDGAEISAGIYLFRARDLRERLDAPDLGPDLVRDIVQPMIAAGESVDADRFDSYWRDVGTIDAYYDASMELLKPIPALNLHDHDWPIYTPSEDRAPAIVLGDGDTTMSLVAHGTRIEGVVRRSIIFPGVHVGPGAVVEDSIIFHDTRVLPRSHVSRAIVDKGARVGEGATVGAGEAIPNREYPHDLSSGLTVLGKGAEVPAGSRIGRNTIVDMGVRESDFTAREIPPGSYVRTSALRRR